MFFFIYLGLLLFTINWLLSREKSPVRNYISDYVHSSYGLLTTIGFYLIGIGILSKIFISPTQIFLLNIELYIFGFLYILLGIFPVDKPGFKSYKGVIHTVAAHLCFEPFSFIILYLILTGYIKDLMTLLLIILSFIGGILMIFFKDKYKGIFQRISIISQLLALVIFF